MWVWYVLGGLVGLFALGAVGVAIALSRGRRGPVESALPADLDAFTAAALLREIRERPELSAAQRAGIDQDIAAIERHHFAAWFPFLFLPISYYSLFLSSSLITFLSS
jgi:hypothetical protein